MDNALTPPKAAQRLNVSERTVRRWVMRALGEERGNTPLTRGEVGVSASGRYFVRRAAVRRLTPSFGTAILL